MKHLAVVTLWRLLSQNYYLKYLRYSTLLNITIATRVNIALIRQTMSRFVSGGTNDQPVERDEDWLKAQQEIEAKRRQKEEESRQEGGKSLYDTLQANKGSE